MIERNPVNNFRDLKVWSLGIELTTTIYEFTKAFPKEELYGLTSQLRRAASSVPANIAEGHGRESTKEYLRFLSIAVGSLSEVETFIEIAARLSLGDAIQTKTVLEMIAEERRMLRGLQRSLKAKLKS